MKILLYSQMGRSEGGGETVFERVANGLERRGYEVNRLYYNLELSAGYYNSSTDGYDMGLYMPSKLKMFLHPKYFYRFIASLVGLFFFLYKTKPAVVNYHFFMASSFHFALLKKVFGYRLVLSCHGSDITNIRGMKSHIAPFVLKRVDLVTAVSGALIKKLKAEIPGSYNTQVIYNGVDFDFWSRHTYKHEKRNWKEELSIVSVGALNNVKGHDILISAFEKVINTYSRNVLLKIIGDGPKRDSYDHLVKSKGLSNHVYFKGWLTSEEVREELHEASLFVFPSRQEGFGLALVEAMAVGLPIVASNTGGIPEILGDNTKAFLVPPEASDELADAIVKALNDIKCRCEASKEFQMRARQFNWVKTVDQYEHVLFSTNSKVILEEEHLLFDTSGKQL